MNRRCTTLLVVGFGMLMAGTLLMAADERVIGGSLMILGSFLLVALIIAHHGWT